MKTEQVEQLRQLIEYWREPYIGTGEAIYDAGKETAYNNCADALEEVLQSFSKDEEIE